MAAKGTDLVRMLDPRTLRTPQQKAFAGMTVLGLVILVVTLLVGNMAGNDKIRSLPDCTGEVTADCIEVVEGTFSARGGDEVKRYFARDGESREPIKISLSSRVSRDLRSNAQGLYVDGDLRGLQDRDGERYWGSRNQLSLSPLGWVALGLGAVMALGGGLMTARARRSD